MKMSALSLSLSLARARFRNLNSFWVVPVCCESLKHVSRVCAVMEYLYGGKSDETPTTCKVQASG